MFFRFYLIGFFRSLFRLLSNSVYVALVCSTCVFLFGIGGTISFNAKYLETQYFLPTWKANMILGKLNIIQL